MFKTIKRLAAHMMKPGTVPMEMKAEPVSESVTEKFYRNLLKEGGIEMVKSRRYKELSNMRKLNRLVSEVVVQIGDK